MTRRSHPPSVAFLLVGLSMLMVTWNGVKIGNNGIVDFVMLPTAAAVIVHLLASGRAVPIPWWLLSAGLAIGLAVLLSTIFPPAPTLTTNLLLQHFHATGTRQSSSGAIIALKFVVGLVGVPFLVAAVANTAQRASQVADLWAISSLISAAVALTDLLHLTHVSAVPSGTDARQAGLTIQPNHLGLTCAMALPVVTVWFTRGGRWRAASVAGGSVLLSAVYASGSRAGTVAALFAVLATVLLVPKLRGVLPNVVPIAGMLVLVALFSSVPQQVGQKVRLSGATAGVAASNSARSAAASLALKDIRARPLQGVGFRVIDDAHNIYLQVLAAGGIITFGAFIFYLGAVARMAARLTRAATSDLARALGVGLVVWLLNGFVGNQVTDRYIFVPIGVLLALSLSARVSEGSSDPAAVEPPAVALATGVATG